MIDGHPLKIDKRVFLKGGVKAVMPRKPGKATLLGALADEVIKHRKLNKDNPVV